MAWPSAYLVSSRTRCPSSGRMQAFVMARRTAASDPGSDEDDAARATPGGGAAQHRRGADLLVAQHAEQLAEAVEALLAAGRRRPRTSSRASDARAAGRDDHLHVRSWRAAARRGRGHAPGRLSTIAAADHLVAGGAEQIGDGAAARVGRVVPRVADRQDVAAHGRRARLLCVEMSHGRDSTFCIPFARTADALRRRRSLAR